MSRRTRIKFCGMTSAEDVALAVDAGADAIGAIVADSPRRVSAAALDAILAAVPPFVTAVLVTAGATDVDLARFGARGVVLQFSGDESAETCARLAAGRPYVRAFGIGAGLADARGAAFDPAELDAFPGALPLFDTRVHGAFGGTGRTFPWEAVATLAERRAIVVSGGLTPDNVAACVRSVRPYAVDVRSGIETGSRKDPFKMQAFVRAVRAADAEADAAGRDRRSETVAIPAAPNV